MSAQTPSTSVTRVDYQLIKPVLEPSQTCGKWIVSDNFTDAPIDWCMAVMSEGDSSTDRIVFLGTSNRNDAYLYAMRRGAIWILDTSIHLPVTSFDAINSMVFGEQISKEKFRSQHRLFNPLPYFGCTACHPPYFPMRYIRDPLTFKENKLDKRTKVMLRDVLVLHSVSASKDDFYTYLTSRTDMMTFTAQKQLVVPHETTMPFVTHSTLYHRQSFPAMFIPSTGAMVRSYLVQQLLRLKGKYMLVSAPFVEGGVNYTRTADIAEEPTCVYMNAEIDIAYNMEALMFCYMHNGLVSQADYVAYQNWLISILKIK